MIISILIVVIIIIITIIIQTYSDLLTPLFVHVAISRQQRPPLLDCWPFAWCLDWLLRKLKPLQTAQGNEVSCAKMALRLGLERTGLRLFAQLAAAVFHGADLLPCKKAVSELCSFGLALQHPTAKVARQERADGSQAVDGGSFCFIAYCKICGVSLMPT